MSLFKARNWWSTELTSDCNESFDQNSLLIARLNENQPDSLIVGSHSGHLRIFRPSTERFDDGTISNYKATDLVLEVQLAHPIIGIGIGKLVSGSQNLHLGVLHPNQFAVYSLVTKDGVTEHGEQNYLAMIYEHDFTHSAYSVVVGAFGGIQSRDFTCIHSLDGILTFYEQESLAFSCSLPNFLIPGPLIYVPRTDSFVTVSSTWHVESFRYQTLSQTSASKVLTPTWSYNLGEGAIDVNALPLTTTETGLVILGERNLYVLTDLGKLKFMKRLDFTPLCLHAYVIEPDARLMILIASDAGTLLLYENSTVRWSAQLPFLPTAMSRANLPGLAAGLITLSQEGQIQCSYLGTEPELHAAPPLALKPIDYDEARVELENLHTIIKANADSADIAFINKAADQEMQFDVTINQTLLPCTFLNNPLKETNDNKPNNSLMCEVFVKVKPTTSMEQIQVALIAQKPFVVSEKCKLFKHISTDFTFQSFVYINNDFEVNSLALNVIVSFFNSQGAPRVLKKTVNLPLKLALNLCAPVKDSEYKVTLNISHPPVPLAQLFPEFATELSNPSAIGFSYINNPQHVVTILSAKSSERYRLQADNVGSLCLLTQNIADRLLKHFQTTADFKIICGSSLPIPQLLNEVDIHFKCRADLESLKAKLTDLSGQYRLVQRRLLSKLKDKIPTPLIGLEGLLRATLQEITSNVHAIEAANRELERSQCRLNCILNLIKTLFEYMTLTKEVLVEANAALCTPVRDFEEQGWEDMTDITLLYLLRTSLSKDRTQKNQTDHNIEIVQLTDVSKFKKHLALALDRIGKEVVVEEVIVKKDKPNETPIENIVHLPDVQEEVEVDTEFNIPDGLKLAERKIEVFRSKPLLERRHKVDEEDDEFMLETNSDFKENE